MRIADGVALLPAWKTRCHQVALAHAPGAWAARHPAPTNPAGHNIVRRAMAAMEACRPDGAAADPYAAGQAHAYTPLEPIPAPRALGARD